MQKENLGIDFLLFVKCPILLEVILNFEQRPVPMLHFRGNGVHTTGIGRGLLNFACLYWEARFTGSRFGSISMQREASFLFNPKRANMCLLFAFINFRLGRILQGNILISEHRSASQFNDIATGLQFSYRGGWAVAHVSVSPPVFVFPPPKISVWVRIMCRNMWVRVSRPRSLAQIDIAHLMGRGRIFKFHGYYVPMFR